MTKNLIFFICLLLIKQITSQTCSCPTTAPLAPQPLADNPNFTFQSETINGVTYGVPSAIGNLVFLPGDVKVTASTTTLGATCPAGYRIPTADEFAQLLATLGDNAYQTLMNNPAFAALEDFNYMTSTKSYPDSTASNLNPSWEFKGLFFDSAIQKVSLISVNTYWEPYKVVRCVLDSILSVNMTPSDLFTNTSYPATSFKANLISYLWRINGSILTDSSVNLNFSNPGCYLVESWAKAPNKQDIYFCKPIYVRNPFGSDGLISTFSSSSIRAIPTSYVAVRERMIFFNEGTAPIAPKEDGGFYVLYSDSVTGNLNVLEFDANKALQKQTDLQIRARPMDIVATPWGFTVLHKGFDDNNLVNLTGFNSDYSQRFQRILMNNGDVPTISTNQITFFDKNSTPASGMNCNFAAQGGKLAYGRGRIAVLWARYNYFGLLADGSRNDHTGDTWMSFDDNGQNEDYAWSWGTSHSLIQAHLYTGRYYVTAALGDAYPQNIQVCVVDSTYDTFFDGVKKQYNRRNKWCTSIATGGNIPGDARGNVCGRFGGIHQLGNTFAVTFTRKPCSLVNAESGQTTSTTLNEISLMTFNFDPATRAFTNVTRRNLLLNVSDRINAIRSGKLGNRILINYLTQKTTVSNTQVPNMSVDGTEVSQYMLVGFDGTIVRTNFSYSPATVAPSDDMKSLKDGSLVWTNLDSLNRVIIYNSITPPSLLNTVTDSPTFLTS